MSLFFFNVSCFCVPGCLSFHELFQSFGALLTLFMLERLFCPKSSILEWCRVLWTRMWPSLLRKLPLGPLFALPSLSFSLEGLVTWECEVGACSWRSHEQASSAKSKFQALWLPRVVRNVVCGFWIFTINWKESALKQLVRWLLEGQAHICMLEMSLVRFYALPFFWGCWASEVLFMSVPLGSANRNPHKVSFIHVAACSLCIIFDFWFLHPPPVLISSLQMVQKTDVR